MGYGIFNDDLLFFRDILAIREEEPFNDTILLMGLWDCVSGLLISVPLLILI